MRQAAAAEEVRRVVSVALDPAFYRAVYPDIAAAGDDPLRHYVETGWREGRDPAPWFSTSAYLRANPDIRRARVEPFFHFLTQGKREGREVAPSNAAEAYALGPWARGWAYEAAPPTQAPPPTGRAPGEPPQELADDRALAAGEFDARYYLATYPDIAEAGVDPLEHFLLTGWREGRDPNARFSTSEYLDAHPDVGQAGINPFVHFLRAGRAEGRAPRVELGFRYRVLSNLRPVAERAAEVAAAAAARRPDAPRGLEAALSHSRTGLADLHVTFSHDDFTANVGGVQLCLQREAERVAQLGRDHLHLYPIDPWPVVRETGEAALLGVLWNGARVGAYAPAEVARLLAAAAGGVAAGARTFAIHSLLGHTPEETCEILAAVGLTRGWFWLHDFASLCAGFHLLRNDVQDCAAPPPDSPACGVCSYGTHRARHIAAHRRLFERLDLTAVAPSEATLELWRTRGFYPEARAVVAPHARLISRGAAPKGRSRRALRVAFAGMPAAHKGWPLFRELALSHEADPRYRFLHLGSRSDPGLQIDFHPVTVSAGAPLAMKAALEAAEADVVLVWPLCRETFSFTAYEAAAAGCAVVTNPDSGNVAAFVRETGHGAVLGDEATLRAAFETGDLLRLHRARRGAELFDLDFSGLTVDLFGEPS